VTRFFARAGLTPNILTILGFLLNVLVGIVVAAGHTQLGGALLLVSSACDLLDGALAKMTNTMTRFGAFLDSTLDRYSEMAVLAGLLWMTTQRGTAWEIILIFIVAVGSLMVSYTRARAEGLGLQCRVGILGRPERILILSIGLIIQQTNLALAILAIFTHLTAIQRMVHVWRETRGS
jgi:CDP-diacylglycerol--glycerol-3-phosphate 3-phosphatidyltransferase